MTRKFSELTGAQRESVAKLVYYADQAVSSYTGLGSLVSWEDADEASRGVAVDIVSMVAERIDGMRGDSDDVPPLNIVVEAHDIWVKAYENRGWVCGEEYNAEAKTSPYLVPFEQLPEEVAIVPVLYVAVATVFFGSMDALNRADDEEYDG